MNAFLTMAKSKIEELQRKINRPSGAQDEGSQQRHRKEDLDPVLDAEFNNAVTPPSTPSATVSNSDGPKSPRSATPVPVDSHDSEVCAELDGESIDFVKFKGLCWGGCPVDRRAECWAILTRYMPLQRSSRVATTERRRAEYKGYVRQHYDVVAWNDLLKNASLGSMHSLSSSLAVSEEELVIMRQVRKDVPRTGGSQLRVVQPAVVQTVIERVLYLWAVRHPACGYVQGMNDIVLPFLLVLLGHFTHKRVGQLVGMREDEAAEFAKSLGDDTWALIEAETYWYLDGFMSSCQSNYTFDQAGAHSMVRKLEQIVEHTNPTLAKHFARLEIKFQEFAFRWINCFLLRELSVIQSIRLFDTYLADNNFPSIHVYVCVVLLERWTPQLTVMDDFGDVMRFLQNPPTSSFTDRDLGEVMSAAFLMQSLYQNAPSHIGRTSKP